MEMAANWTPPPPPLTSMATEKGSARRLYQKKKKKKPITPVLAGITWSWPGPSSPAFLISMFIAQRQNNPK